MLTVVKQYSTMLGVRLIPWKNVAINLDTLFIVWGAGFASRWSGSTSVAMWGAI